MPARHNYLCCLQMATLGYGDIVPSTAVETGVDCFIIAFGVLMFGIIMGSIAEQVANSSREAQQAQVGDEGSLLAWACWQLVRSGMWFAALYCWDG